MFGAMTELARRFSFSRSLVNILTAWRLLFAVILVCAACSHAALSAPVPIWAVFTPDDSDLPNGRVRALAFAADGALWAGTDGGLVRLDRDGGWQVYDRADSDGGLPSDIV